MSRAQSGAAVEVIKAGDARRSVGLISLISNNLNVIRADWTKDAKRKQFWIACAGFNRWIHFDSNITRLIDILPILS